MLNNNLSYNQNYLYYCKNNTRSTEIATKISTCNTMADNTTNMKDCSTSISPERMFNSPAKTRMQKVHALEIQSLKKLYIQNYNQKKMQTKLKSLKAVLKELQKRNLISPDEGEILQHLEKGTRELIKRQIRKQQHLPVSRTYKASLRQFALSLHYYSPKAYNYVRNNFYNCLPHVKTLLKWYRSFDGEPGINVEILEAIKLCVCSVID